MSRYFLGETQSDFVRVRSQPCLTKVHLDSMQPPIERHRAIVKEEGMSTRREAVITCHDRDRRDRMYLNTFNTFTLSPTRKRKAKKFGSMPALIVPRLFPANMKVTDQ